MRHAPQDNRDYQWLDADGEAGVGSIILSAGQRASQRALSIAGEKSRRGRAIESVKRLYKRLSQVETAVYSLQAMQRQAMTVLESCRAAVHMVAYSVKILQVGCPWPLAGPVLARSPLGV